MRLLIITCTIISLFSSAHAAHASSELELGITPNQVYGIWMRIIEAIDDAVALQESNSGSNLAGKYKVIRIQDYQEKKPEDVLQRAKAIKNTLEPYGLGKEKLRRPIHENKLIEILGTTKTITTPSNVYIESLHIHSVLLAHVIIPHTPTLHVGEYFNFKTYEEKKPGHVYQLAVLAEKKIHFLINHLNAR